MTTPTILDPVCEEIPLELKSERRWVLWRLEWQEAKKRWNKTPYMVTGKYASSTDPATWTDFDTAWNKYQSSGYSGIGFVLGDGWVGVDLDGCRDRGTGIVEGWAYAVLRRVHGYVEISVSGTGVHVICRGELPPGKRERDDVNSEHRGIAVYDKGRYFTISGHVLPELEPIADITDELTTFHTWLFANNGKPASSPKRNAHQPDSLEDALASDNKFRCLWYGDTTGYASASEADIALCVKLIFWFGRDMARIDELFRQSGLMRDKWLREDYRNRTINAALEFQQETRRNGTHRTGTARTQEREEEPPPPITRRWPDPLRTEALHGPASEVVEILDPHTEADPAAILIQTLVAWGALIGRGPYQRVEADLHHTNLYCVLVGATSKGRKGSSWGRVQEALGMVDNYWLDNCILGGLGSGEALISEMAEAEANDGDKRRLILESEFARVLAVAAREHSTLSHNIRDAWDIGMLRHRLSKSKSKVSGVHISLIGHITKDELLRRLADNTEIVNGLCNRMLWVCVRRSKLLSRGGGSPDLTSIAEHLKTAAEVARRLGNTRLQPDDETWALWDSIYKDLSEGQPGLLGAATSRSEAQVLRLALVYALLDQAKRIHIQHLRAALAVWDYCYASAKFIWGDAIGDPVADRIFEALRKAKPEGLTRSDIRDLFSRHQSPERMALALATLLENGRVRSTSEGTDGRPIEKWYAL